MTETQEQTQVKKGFAPAQVGIKHTLSCVGQVTDVGDCKPTSTGKYLWLTFNLEQRGGTERHRQLFMFHPEWFSVDFDPTSNEGSTADFVYKQNINSNDTKDLRTLYHVAGSEENYGELCERLASIPQMETLEIDNQVSIPDSEVTRYCTQVTEVFKAFFQEYNPQIGYVLRQKSEKVGTDPETGKGVWERTKFYEVSKFFYVTEAALKQERKIADGRAKAINKLLSSDDPKKVQEGRNSRKYICTFDTEVAF